MGIVIHSGRGIQDMWLIHAQIAAPPVPRYYLEFDGISSYINCGDNASLQNLHASDFTVDFWHRASAVPWDGFAVSKHNRTGGPPWRNWGWMIDTLPGKSYSMDVFYSIVGAYSNTDDLLVADGSWNHCVWVFNASGDKKCYCAVNGTWTVYLNQVAANGVPETDIGTPFRIGVEDIGYYLSGDISWLRVSNGIRYPIGVNFVSPSRCIPPAIDGTTVELWTLDEGIGVTTAASVNSPANDGAMTNCTWHDCI